MKARTSLSEVVHTINLMQILNSMENKMPDKSQKIKLKRGELNLYLSENLSPEKYELLSAYFDENLTNLRREECDLIYQWLYEDPQFRKVYLQLLKLASAEKGELLAESVFSEIDRKYNYNLWELGNKIIVFAGGGAFLGGVIGQFPGAIIGAISATLYAIIFSRKQSPV